MSNRDDFDDDFGFGDDDDFGDLGRNDDDFGLGDDFGFEDNDDFGGADDSFGFEENDEFGLGDDFDDDLGGDFEEDMPELGGGDTGDGGGVSRTFLIIAGIMIGLFVLVLGVILFLALRETGPTDLELTATAIVETNVAIEQFRNETATASVILGQTQTAQAMFTDTPTVTPTNTRPPTNTPSPTQDATSEFATQTILDATATASAEAFALAQTQTEQARPTETEAGPDPADIAATGTALVEVFEGLTQTAIAREEGAGTPEATAAATSADPATTPDGGVITQDELPDAGVFDDFANGSLGYIALAAFGLIGVIFVSRTIRSRGSDET